MIAALSSTILGALALALYWYTRSHHSAGAIALDWRSVLARLPLPMLALAASFGVFSFALLFVPWWVALIQAAAFEMTYIGLAVVKGLGPDQRKRATAISVGAVVASIVYNTLAGWFHRQPQLLAGADEVAWLAFAVLHGAPLAWVAYLVADLLLHSAPRASRRPSQIRALVRRLTRALRDVRKELAPLGAMLAQARTDLEQARAELADALRTAAQQGQDAAQQASELAQRDVAIEQLRSQLAQAQASLAQAQAELTQRPDTSVIDVWAIAQELRAHGVPLRRIGVLIGVSEGTVRNRTVALSRNGHAVEA